ncbi:MAG: RecX family transcriptional regulator, partial [Actinobacteria bacterium]|nr:RecX family transcriptional regulator [Actinomycetota bacterium]
AGIAPAERRGALDSLTRAGVVSDERLARARAGLLAERGEGDGAIRWRLEGEGMAAELVERALGELEPEAARAGRIVARRGATDTTARVLARRGFSWDAIEAALEGAAGQTP